MKNDKPTDKNKALARALARIDETRKPKPHTARAVHLPKQEFGKSAKRKLLEPINPNYRSLFCEIDEQCADFFVLPQAAHSHERDITRQFLNVIQAFVVRLIFVGFASHSLLSVFESSFRHRKNNSIVLCFEGFVKIPSRFGAAIGFLSLQA